MMPKTYLDTMMENKEFKELFDKEYKELEREEETIKMKKLEKLEKIFHDHSLGLANMDASLNMGITKDTLIYCGKRDNNGNPITHTLTKDYVQGYRDSYNKLRKEIIEKIIDEKDFENAE